MKLFNDPVHGFIAVPDGLVRQLVDHPIVQRLRRIKQMGASSLVYPGAEHTRFHHALGALHLTRLALDTLREKGYDISPSEYTATLCAILLHDVGHGPFSHALETVLVPGMRHERLSRVLIERLAGELGGELPLALAIFDGTYPRRFLHQLVAGQLDMDRLDYLVRDSFFTGVVEGNVAADRIIKTLVLVPDSAGSEVLAVEEKGIYSVEQFLLARRIMYWQVYFHKTALAAEQMLVRLMERLRTLVQAGTPPPLPDGLARVLAFPAEADTLSAAQVDAFLALDDHDVWMAIKTWAANPTTDYILHHLSQRLLTRRLLKLRYQPAAPTPAQLAGAWNRQSGIPEAYRHAFVFAGQVTNEAYRKQHEDPIWIRYKDGRVDDILAAADLHNLDALAQPVTKHYLVQPG